MNPFRRLLDFISYPSHSRTMGVLAFLIVVLAIPLTVNIAQKQQELRQRASTCAEGQTETHVNLGTFCNDISTQMTGVGCSVTTDTTAQCPGTGSKFSCYQIVCNGSSVSTPVTPPPTPPPAVQPPAAPPTVTPTAPPSNASCPGTGQQIIPFGDGSFGWGGPCTFNNHQTQLIPGSTCQYEACEEYKGPNGNLSGPTCWFSSGLKTVCTPAPITKEACEAKPGECLVNASCPDSRENLGACILPGFANGICCKSQALPACDAETTVTTCQAATNTCNGTGTRTRTLDKLSTGGACTAKAPELINCDLSSAVNNCATGNSCQNGPGPSGQCIAQVNPPPTTLPSPGPGDTILSFTLGLDGLGSTGDNRNPFNSSGSNKNPNRKTRNVFAQLVDSGGGNVGTEKIGYMKFTADGKFDAAVDLGTVSLGTYTVRVRSEGYLWRSITAPLTIVDGDHTYTLSSVVNLVTGDLDGDNLLTASDFNILSDCFKNNSASTSCDIDDDGKITLFDLNLFLREFPVQHGD